MSRMPKKDYFRMRLTQAIKMGNTRKAKYFQSRLEQLTQSEPKSNESAKESALRKCRKAFEGLDESGRLIEANRMFTIACDYNPFNHGGIGYISYIQCSRPWNR